MIAGIPEDLEVKLAQFKVRLPAILDHWTKIVSTHERILKRRVNQSTDLDKLSASLLEVVVIERSGWRLGQERVEAVEQFFGEVIGEQALVETKNAEKGLEEGLEALKRVESFPAEYCVARLTCHHHAQHRELYTSFRDLFTRESVLSVDSVDKLRKRIDSSKKKVNDVVSISFKSDLTSPLP